MQICPTSQPFDKCGEIKTKIFLQLGPRQKAASFFFVFFFFTIIFICHGPRTIMLSLMTSVHGHILLEPGLYCHFILHFTAYDHQTGTLAVVFTNYFSISTAHIILDSLMIKLLGRKLKRNNWSLVCQVTIYLYISDESEGDCCFFNPSFFMTRQGSRH